MMKDNFDNLDDLENNEEAASTEAIEKAVKNDLVRSRREITVGKLEKSLLKAFPEADAEPWDKTGLQVGNRAKTVSAVAIALDPTVDAIKSARNAGANVLVTHHPPFLESPKEFGPADSIAQNEGAAVWRAIKDGVSLMCFHTALDVSRQAQKVLPNLLGLVYKGELLKTIPDSRHKGYGQICSVSKSDSDTLTLGRLAAKCTSVFGIAPRVWGDFQVKLSKIATATGSASSLKYDCVEAGIDCLICGEIGYHAALELKDAGIAVIELGHDISELPLTAVLAAQVADAGVAKDSIVILDQTGNWKYPESIRI